MLKCLGMQRELCWLFEDAIQTARPDPGNAGDLRWPTPITSAKTLQQIGSFGCQFVLRLPPSELVHLWEQRILVSVYIPVGTKSTAVAH
jgi:hypothetical protein